MERFIPGSTCLKLPLAAMVLLLGTAPAAWAQTPEQVNRAINRGVDYLKSRQRLNGGWDDFGDYTGGVTALVTIALLSCDVPADDPKVQSALQVLRAIEPKDTYVVALQTMALAEATPKADFLLIKRNAAWLMQTRQAGGMWSYGSRNMGAPDNSNTQYALLGLLAAAEAGVDIPAKFWVDSRAHWISSQEASGSWGYTGRGATGSMTVAGIASLKITGRQLKQVKAGVAFGQPVRCDGALEDRNLDAGINWVGRNFSVSGNPGGSNTWLYYYLYGLERAGRLTGRRFFGDHDWYRSGVRYLVARQRVDGSWTEGGGGGVNSLYDTAFALLFLSKGRIPIIINKLKYGRGGDWNNAPNDINNLTVFLAKLWQKKLNWQVVESRVASVEDLLQAPVLQFSGHSAPRFTDKEKQSLKEFVEQGGLLVVDANCSVKEFDKGFRELCKELFPEPGQELRRLEPEHGVWSSLFNLEALANNWPLYGIDIGCRTGVFYSPEDLSCQWEHDEELDDPKSAAMPAFRLGANIVAYATGPENLSDKLADRKVFKAGPDDEIQRNFLQVAKIRHNGDWNPAPQAIRNLMISLHDIAKIDVVRQQRDIDLLDPNLFNYPLAYMHGRTKFVLSRKERDMLAEYINNGGMLFGDACCGNERFDEAFRTLMKEIFPDKKLEPIPLEHELFTRETGYDISRVTLGKALGGREAAPALEGIEIDGRYAVIYSKYDLGCALQRQQGSDCKGYTHDSAIQIATNIVLYALKQ